MAANILAGGLTSTGFELSSNAVRTSTRADSILLESASLRGMGFSKLTIGKGNSKGSKGMSPS